ncbi:MAG: tRNA uridine-5-carboxymethylaminomethyl(34) synthesis GTPase MnmE [candidate division WOR-3 bacterium]
MRLCASDTIAAIATASGISALSIIRISGPKAHLIADKIFINKIKPSQAKSHTVHYGKIRNPLTKQIIDEVMLTVFTSPSSYTGEDMVEISCHGGDYVVNQILQLIIKCGARLAEPGEFTRRRVLAGKMDLTQAEAILDLTYAQNEYRYQSAIAQLQGRLSNYINTLSQTLKDLIANLENLLEFEESTSIADRQLQQTKRILNNIIKELETTTKRNERLQFLHNGIYCVIVGKANVGKSSLFNRLIESERAIVTNIPGTTRDTLKETTIIKNLTFHFIDTAGFKKLKSTYRHYQIDALGIQKSKDWLANADCILAVFDNSRPFSKQDQLILSTINKKPHIVVLNKIDRPSQFDTKTLQNHKIVRVSAKYNQGIDKLKQQLANMFHKKINHHNHYLALNQRHLDILKQVVDLLKAVENEKYLDTMIINLRSALDALNNFTNPVNNEQILDTIFSKFCIGK